MQLKEGKVKTVAGGGGGVVGVRNVLKRAVSVDMYKMSVKGKVRRMSDNVNKMVEELK